MKKCLVILAVYTFLIYSTAALDVSWSGPVETEPDNFSWENTAAWWNGTGNSIPTASDRVIIRDGNWYPDTGPSVYAGTSAHAASLEIGLTRKDGNGYLVIDGGELDVAGEVKIGVEDLCSGTLTVNSGTMSVGGSLSGWHGSSEVNVYGGLLSIDGWLTAGQFNDQCNVNIYGGELEANWIGGQGTINIAGGTLIIAQSADKRPDLQAKIDAGDIVAYGGNPDYELEMSFDGIDNRVYAVNIYAEGPFETYETQTYSAPVNQYSGTDRGVRALFNFDNSDVTGVNPEGVSVLSGENYGAAFVDSMDNFGLAASFNGASDYMLVPQLTELFLNGEMTVECYVKVNEIYSTRTQTIAVYGENSYATWRLGIDTMGHAYLEYQDGWEYFRANSSAFLTPGQWYHIAFTRSIELMDEDDPDYDEYYPHRAVCRSFINGVFDSETVLFSELPGHTNWVDQNVMIGKDRGDSNHFNGCVDELQFCGYAKNFEPVLEDPSSPYTRLALGTDLLVHFDADPANYYAQSTASELEAPFAVMQSEGISRRAGYITIDADETAQPGSGQHQPIVEIDQSFLESRFHAGAISVEAWIKLASYPIAGNQNYNKYVIAQNGEQGYHWQLFVNPDRKAVMSYCGTDWVWREAVGTTELELDRWYHIAGVKRALKQGASGWNYETHLEVYVNGQLEGMLEKALRPLPPNDTGKVYIGNSPYWTIFNFDGSIGEVRISSVPRAYSSPEDGRYGWYNPGDVNQDGMVNLLDASETAGQWLENDNAWLDKGGYEIASDGSEDMLLFMNSTLPQDRVLAFHSEVWNGAEWTANTQTHGLFSSKVNMAWNRAYWRKDTWTQNFHGEIFTIGADGLIRLHTESFGQRVDEIEPLTQPVFDSRIDRFRLFVNDDGGELDWGLGKVFAPVNADTEWVSTAPYDTYICNSFDDLNNGTGLKWQDIDSRYAFLERYGPFDVEFDGGCDGWPVDDVMRNLDEVIVLNQLRDNQNVRERYFYGRSGDTYLGLVRWDEHHKEDGQWVPVARAVSKHIGYMVYMGGFEGFFERSINDTFTVNEPDVCQVTGIIASGDLNGDCSVGVEDFMMIAQNWLN
ncbi:hypothetical protein SMSP2_01849 [Limihaloglobus sulfuriphilus]|uniref:LamG-like jellyroll fold domain-containing protein n=1 Tax=Limihaloglobus sulfuriphilus TaxID=1851148 RepID=A0A1Q2MFJ0_9BACT|nr:LamG domain-containing protein [Limihaloglobus sulfuriphilus]AQQ71475.1 hypothetical protein SMSP2_01849 [Limihaloglobus sulfuriphilus]